jgi:hypothetical protein
LAAAAGCMDGQQSDSAPSVSHLKAPGCEVLRTRLAPRLSARSITYGGSMLHGHFRQTTMALPTRVEPGEPHKL